MKNLYVLAILSSFGLLIGWSAITRGTFLSDDWIILELLRDKGPFGVWAGMGENLFRPVATALAWLFDYAGLNAVAFHITNLALTILSSFCIFLLTRRGLVKNGVVSSVADLTAVIAALIFLLNPVHADVTNWAAALNLTLSLALGLSGLVAFTAWLESRRRIYLSAWLILTTMAMLTRETAFFFSCIAVLFALLYGEKKWQLTGYVFTAMALGVGYFVLRMQTLGGLIAPENAFSRSELKNSIVVSFNSSIFPFGRWLDVIDSKLPSLTVLVVLLLPVCVVARKISRQTPISSVLGLFLLLWLLIRMVNAVWIYTLGNWFDGALIASALFMVAIWLAKNFDLCKKGVF